MANIEQDSTDMSLSPTTDSAIGRIDGERYEDIKTSLQLEELPSGSICNKRKQKALSDSVLGTKFEGPSKKSKGTSFIGHKGNISEEEINGKERNKKDSLPSDDAQNEVDISSKEKVYAGEEEEVTSKEQSKKGCLHSDVTYNEVELSLKGKTSAADEEVDVINDAVKETGSSVGKGDGKAPWLNTFDLNELSEVEEDQPNICI